MGIIDIQLILLVFLLSGTSFALIDFYNKSKNNKSITKKDLVISLIWMFTFGIATIVF
ncbi:MAG: hypothetical protein FWF57_00910 [Defluviitaleaceae bacterium]|nr:hypothetical protein [Defluviitaleaceae bacterium]